MLIYMQHQLSEVFTEHVVPLYDFNGIIYPLNHLKRLMWYTVFPTVSGYLSSERCSSSSPAAATNGKSLPDNTAWWRLNMWTTLFASWRSDFSRLRFHLLLCRTTSLQIRLHPETGRRSWEGKFLAWMLKCCKSMNMHQGNDLKALIKWNNKKKTLCGFTSEWSFIYQ